LTCKISQKYKNAKKTAEHPVSAEGAGLSGGQPQDFQSLKDNVLRRLLSTK
jgi:hypothetical protein